MDIKTIIICLFVVNLAMGFFMLTIKKTQRTFPGIDYWILSNFFISFGYLLMAGRSFLPFILTIVLAQLLFFSAGIIRIIGLNAFFGIKTTNSVKIYVIILLIIYFFVFYYFSYISNNVFIRTLISGIALSLLSFITGLKVLKHRPGKNNFAYKFIAVTFFLFSMIFLVRISAWILIPENRGLFTRSVINILQFLSSLIIDFTWSTMFFVIHNQKLYIKLSESEAQKNAILNGISVNIAFVDTDLKIIWANDTAARSVNKSPEQLIGKHCYGFWANPEMPCKDCPTKKAITSLKKENIIITTPDGRVWDESGEPIFDHEGNLIGLVEIAQDITERVKNEQILKKSETKLKELNATKDKFFSILAHDLKSPFNTILGFSDILRENIDAFDNQKIKSLLDIIHSTTQNTYNLFEEILLWAKSQSGQLVLEIKAVNFNIICNELVNSLKTNASAKNISINYFSESDFILAADENMLRTIIRNLISNAIKFTPNGGKINIYAMKEADSARITVSDTGIGISPSDIDKIWDITNHFSTKGTANEKGSGLGLILCKEFTEKHNGKIWVESTPGKGAQFIFTIPLYINEKK